MRLKTPTVDIRGVKMGSDHPIVIQSMTNTDTQDPLATVEQCIQLADAGSEIVRVTVNTNLAAKQIPELRRILNERGYEHLPIIGDFHYNGHTLLTEFPEMAATLDKYRINPGNVGFGDKHEYNFSTMVKVAIKNDKPVRIGVNWGSLDQDLLTEMMDSNAKLIKPKGDKEVIIEAMVESAMRSAKLAEKLGLSRDKIILSVKMSEVQDMISAYQDLTVAMADSPYALHLGLTEAGAGMKGAISSSAALAILLQQGIGDTIRISLTPTPDRPRTEEVEACKQLLQSMGYRHFRPQVTSCPGCGRTDSTFFQELAAQVNAHIDAKMPEWKEKYPKVVELKIAVMGCVVNGPGESKHADIAISLPGRMEKPVAPVYIKGEFSHSLQGEDIPKQFMKILEKYIEDTALDSTHKR
jgi:(E)-4-hydroxy-3-methylbut-2-enyl-diphosphate synthase